MEIFVLLKPVPEGESRLRVSADGRRLDLDGVKFVLAGYDESAVEQALLLKESAPGSTVRAVSFGPARCEEILRAAIALGCDAATWVEGPSEAAEDPMVVARALATAIAPGGASLILAGKQAGDDEEGLVPAAVAERLGVPSFGHVLDLRAGPDGASLRFARATEAGTERWECPLPCVIGLQQAWNDPRTAKLPNILKSRKAAIAKVAWTETAAALGAESRPTNRPEAFALPPPRAGAKMIEFKTPDDAAEQLVRALREEAKVFP